MIGLLAKTWRFVRRPPWRTVVPASMLLLGWGAGYLFWSPGLDVTDGRHDQGQNGIWLQHGWLGDDLWFTRNQREDRKPFFRDRQNIKALAALLRRHGIRDVFPHLCPAGGGGRLPDVDPEQTERFLDEFSDFRVIPWIGGSTVTVTLSDPRWRKTFCDGVGRLLRDHPRLGGVQVNVEPCPSGNEHLLRLLEELRKAIPQGKVLSVAAYPPPTWWHPHQDVHWDRPYFEQVAARCDQVAVMMYDTALKHPRVYRRLMKEWTGEVLAWSGKASVLLGLPAYDDRDSGYHHPDVENLHNALLGIHAALADVPELPANYQGVAIYCEWEMDEGEWQRLRGHFNKPPR